MFFYLDSENKELHIQYEKIICHQTEKDTWIKKETQKYWKAQIAKKVQLAAKTKTKKKKKYYQKEEVKYA